MLPQHSKGPTLHMISVNKRTHVAAWEDLGFQGEEVYKQEGSDGL